MCKVSESFVQVCINPADIKKYMDGETVNAWASGRESMWRLTIPLSHVVRVVDEYRVEIRDTSRAVSNELTKDLKGPGVKDVKQK